MANRAINDLLKYGGRWVNYVQPTLSANGTLGGSVFACEGAGNPYTQGTPYMAVDGSTGTRWIGYYPGSYITLYTPQAVKCSQVYFHTSDQHINGLTYYGSDDNSTWSTIYSGYTQSANTTGYMTIAEANQKAVKYHKFYLTANTYLALWEMRLIGKYLAR